jgi:hypothetical protein
VIDLYFNHIETGSYEEMNKVSDLSMLEEWPRGYLCGRAFLGGQIFIIDSANFSGDYPILGFARQLNIIAHNLETDGRPGWYGDPGLEKDSTTKFDRDNHLVLITEVRRSTRATIASARIPVSEFLTAVESYLATVFDHCCKLVPKLKGRQDVEDWLFDFSDTGYRPFSNLK